MADEKQETNQHFPPGFPHVFFLFSASPNFLLFAAPEVFAWVSVDNLSSPVFY